MSPKQKEYQHLLIKILPSLRNISTLRWWQKCIDKSCYYDAELIHNLPVSMWDEDFVAHDIWFLNHQVRVYVEECGPRLSPNYEWAINCIRNLFEIVPEDLKAQLEWSGPLPDGR